MRREDLAEITVLERVCFGDPWSERAFEEEIARGDLAHNRVLREGGRLCAYSVAWIVADEVHLANLAVAPEERGRGLGAALLRDLLREGRRRGAAVVYLEVRRSNRPAIALYEKFGFRRAGVRKNYYRREGEDALVLFHWLRDEEEGEGGALREQEGVRGPRAQAGRAGRDLGQVPGLRRDPLP